MTLKETVTYVSLRHFTLAKYQTKCNTIIIINRDLRELSKKRLEVGIKEHTGKILLAYNHAYTILHPPLNILYKQKHQKTRTTMVFDAN